MLFRSCFEELVFEFVEFLGDDHPRSRSVSAANLCAGRIFTVVWVGFVIDGEVDPGDGLVNGVTVTGIVSVRGWRVKLMDEVWRMEG